MNDEQTMQLQTQGRPHNPLTLLEKAVASGANVEVMDRLMGLQERWEANQARKAFDNAISEAKREMPVLTKGNTVDFSSSKGRTHYRYEDLASIAKAVDPILSKHGLSYRFRTESDDKSVTVSCVLSHRHGHSEANSLRCGHDLSGNKNAIQAIGSAVTYLQRYTLKAALGLSASNDDDGQSAAPRPSDRPQAPVQPRNPPPKPPQPTEHAKTPAKPAEPVKATEEQPKQPTEKTRSFMFERMTAAGLSMNELMDYANACGFTGADGAWKLDCVPTSKTEIDQMIGDIKARRQNDQIPEAESPDAWRQYPMPFGNNAGTPLADLDKKYLYGLWRNFSVETEYNGHPKKPETIARDQEFRRMLDAAGEHYEFKT